MFHVVAQHYSHSPPTFKEYNPPNIHMMSELGVCKLHYHGLHRLYLPEWFAITVHVVSRLSFEHLLS